MEIALCSDSTFIIGDSKKFYDFLLEPSEEDFFIKRLFEKYVKMADIGKTKDSLLKLKKGKVKDQLIKAFEFTSKTAEYCFEDYGEYIPIRIVLMDSPYRYLNIPLEDYDNLEGDPLWMRPEYMLEKYYPKEKQDADKQTLEQMKKDHPDWF